MAKNFPEYLLVLYTLDSKIGSFYCYFSEKGLFQMLLDKDISVINFQSKGIRVIDTRNAPKKLVEFSKLNFQILKEELNKYFTGELKNFSVTLDFSFYTDFQRQVINYLTTIPFGKVMSYKDVAKNISKPKSYRAVGNAVANNRTLIVVPCHRVIKSDGSIGWFGGYGNGKELKKKILIHEGVRVKN